MLILSWYNNFPCIAMSRMVLMFKRLHIVVFVIFTAKNHFMSIFVCINRSEYDRAAAVAVLPPHHLHADRPVPGPDRAGATSPTTSSPTRARRTRRSSAGRSGSATPSFGTQKFVPLNIDQDTRLHPRRHDVHQSPRRLRQHDLAIK